MGYRTIFSVAASEYRRFFLNPRIMVLGMLLIFTDNLVISLLLSRADKMEIPLNLAEPFIAVGNSGVLLLFMPAVFLILASDFPNLGNHTLFVIQRTKRLPWLFGQLLAALLCIITYIAVIFSFCCLLTARNGVISTEWSDTVTKYSSVFPEERNTLVSEYLPSNLYNQMTFRAALGHTILTLTLYLFLLCLILSFFRILGMRTAGIAASFSVIACGVVTCSLKTEMMWLFPMANTIPWLHYSEALREPVKPMEASYLYFVVLIMVGIAANVIAVKKANVYTMEAE